VVEMVMVEETVIEVAIVGVIRVVVIPDEVASSLEVVTVLVVVAGAICPDPADPHYCR